MPTASFQPPPGARVLAFHPVARAWRPATVAALGPGEARVHFVGYGNDEPIEQVVKLPEELEPLSGAADFVGDAGETPRTRNWRGILLTLAVNDPGVYGERRAAANLSPDGVDLYALLVAAMLDADARIPGGAALFVRLQKWLAGCDPRRLGACGEAEIAAVGRLMPSPLRARVLFTNARRFVELDATPGGFVAWLRAQADPVAALCQTFDRLEPRAAVLFLRMLGFEAIAPDEPLVRVAQRLGWVRHHPRPATPEVRDVWTGVAATVGDRPALLDLTVRRFAEVICQVEPQCRRCAVPVCPARRAESDVALPD